VYSSIPFILAININMTGGLFSGNFQLLNRHHHPLQPREAPPPALPS
jgi:hypothetical protein